VVVVDSGSDDGTETLCRRRGARVISRKWAGYAAQKQFAMSRVDAPWVLNLDADERVPAVLAEEMQAAVASAPADVAGFSMPRLSRFLGRWIRHGGWYPDRKIRLARQGHARWVGEGLHERLQVTGRIGELSSPLLHYGYRDISDQVETVNRFSTVYADTRRSENAGYVLAGVFHAFGKFLECYAWKTGFRDGLPGLIIAMNSSWYVFLKHAKTWEAGRRQRETTG
jgi:glycosyltransferase involved in cell wall biosynthesis